MSFYAAYLTERTGDSIVETEYGFATFRYIGESQVYIIDIYIAPDYRQLNKASEIADLIVAEAKKLGKKQLLGTVVPSTKGSTTSLKVLLGYGMTLDSASQDLIIFKKDI